MVKETSLIWVTNCMTLTIANTTYSTIHNTDEYSWPSMYIMYCTVHIKKTIQCAADLQMA